MEARGTRSGGKAKTRKVRYWPPASIPALPLRRAALMHRVRPRCGGLGRCAPPSVVLCGPQAAAKRFKVTGGGKVMARRSGKQHMNEKKTTEDKE